MADKAYSEFDGIRVKKVPTVKSVTYEDSMNEAEVNRQNLEDSIVDLIVHYFKNK